MATDEHTPNIINLPARRAPLSDAERARNYRARKRHKRRPGRSKAVRIPIETVTAPVTAPVTNGDSPTVTIARRAVTAALANWQDQPPTPAVAMAVDKLPTVEVLPPNDAHAHHLPRSTSRALGAAVLIIVAIGIAALALVINMQVGFGFGRTPTASLTFAGLSLAGDLLAIVLPSAAAGLWNGRRRALSLAAWSTWLLAAALAMLASLGFVETNLSDTAVGRQAIVTTARATADQRTAAITAAQIALTTATQQREAECTRRGPLCRDREADERTALQALNTAIAMPLPTVATIADSDPQVSAALRLATWAGLRLEAVDVANVRLLLMVLLPNISGLVLCFGLAMAQGRRANP